MLGDLGAEIIKIEAPFLPDGRIGGYLLDNQPGEDPWESSGIYQKNNRSKRAISMDLRQAPGRETFKDLVAIADVIIENYSPRNAAIMLDYDHLRGVKNNLIFISLPEFGASGPQKDWLAYGTTLDSHCGLVSLTGYENGPPHRMPIAIGDPVGGMYGTLAVLGALFRRRSGAGGTHLDLAQSEALIQFVGPSFINWFMNRRHPDRMGNRDADFAPQDCFPAEGDDEWVAISVAGDEEWRALCDVIGRPDLAADYPTVGARHAAHSAIVTAVSAWTEGRSKHEATEALQTAGVTAGPVNTSRDVILDQHMRARGAFELVRHPDGSTRPQVGPAHLSATPSRVTRPALRFGQDNNYVFSELLGYAPERIEALHELKIISDAPLVPTPARAPVDLARWREVGIAARLDGDYRAVLREVHGAEIATPRRRSRRRHASRI